MRSLRRLLVPFLAAAILLPSTLSGSATPPPPADLQRAAPYLEALGIGYGTTVDGEDVRRLADRLGLGVGSVVDVEDLDRVLDVARRTLGDLSAPDPTTTTAAPPPPAPTDLGDLARYLDAFGISYGSTVDAADARRLAERLGVNVGASVDPADVARIAEVAERRLEVRFPAFAAVGSVTLRLPSEHVELVGFHESNHDGARQLTALPSTIRSLTLPTRDRGTGSRTAADIVAAPGSPIRAPVSGRVLRAGTYVLYCEHSDDFAVIEPDDRPGWEVKLLHIDGVRVRAGDRVEAARTVIAGGPTPLPLRSQVDRYTADRNWPHVHLEVVDPSIPDRPSPGGGC